MTAPGGVIATVYVRVLPQIRDFGRDLRQSLQQSSRQLRTIDRELAPVTRALGLLGRTATGIVPGVRLARTSLLALGAHAVVGGILAAAGAATTLSGALATLPAIGVGAASVVGALVVGLDGVKSALKDFRDVEAFNEGLEQLSGNARATLGVLNEFRGELTAFRDSVQDRLFAGLDDVARDLVTTFLPRLQTHFGNIADLVNAAAKDLAAFAQSGQTLADVDETTANVELGMVNLRQALLPAAEAFRDLVVVGSRFLPFITLEVSRLATEFSTWISNMRATGELQEAMARGLAALQQLGRIAGNVGESIRSVLTAAQASGNGLTDTLERLTENMAGFLASTRGQEALASFFESTSDAAKALSPVLVSLVDLLFNSVFPVLEGFATRVGPAVSVFFDRLGDAIDIAAPGIMAFASGFATFIQAITPVLPLIGQLVGQLGVLVGVLAAKLGPVIADVATGIGNLLMPILQAFTAIFTLISPEVLRFAIVLGVVIAAVSGLIGIIRGVQAVVGLFAGAMSVMAGGAIATQGALARFVGFLAGPWGIAIELATVALGLFLSSADNTSESINGLRQAMENTEGTTENAAREWARQKLEMDGVADTAGKFKISLTELTDAYLGLPGAQEAVTNKILQNGDAANANHDETQRLIDVVREGPEVYDQAREAVERKNAADQSSVSIVGALTGLLETQRAALALVREELDRQQAAQLAALNSDLAYRQQLTQTTEALANNTATLDINTTEGQENLKTLASLALAGQRRVKDLLEEGATTAEVNTVLKANQDQLLALLGPYFESAEAARNFAIQVGLIPRDQINIKASFDSGGAIAAIQALISNLNNLKGTFAIINKIPFIGGPLAQLGLAASANARGGPVAAGEWTWVGEEGPELVRFGRAARIFSADESERMSSDVGHLDMLTRDVDGGGRRPPVSTTSSTGTTTVDNHITVEPTVKVYVDGQELRGIVRVELNQRDRQLRRLMMTGAGTRGN